MKHRTRSRRGFDRGGFALLSVLFVLIALLVLCAPFLMTARNASRASTQQAERVQTRLALDSAVRHARASLGRSHPGIDSTPYFDDEQELFVESTLAPQFWNNHDPKGVMWDVDAYDVAGRIDIGSAPPQVFANVLGAVTRLSEPLKAKNKDISVLSVRGFEPQGFLWVGPELVSYSSIDDTKFSGLTRGLAAVLDQDGKWNGCGPSPPLDLPINVTVIDQRAFAIPFWRIVQADSGLRSFDAIEQVRDAGPLALSGSLGAVFTAQLASHMSVYGGVRAGPAWARAVRITDPMRANEDCVVRVSERRNFNPGTTVLISDGRNIEFGIVLGMDGDNGLRLMNPVKLDYIAYNATIAPLIRRPVNINIAPGEVLEALFFNLQLRDRSDRITRSEAQSLVALCLESRPFTGLEDFLRRVVLPAAGVELLPEDAPVKPAVLAGGAAGAIIDVDDALALYANALNANDERLAYSTMPLSFVSRDVYALDARAAVNAESGAQRSAGVREEVALVVPQDELLAVWARQEDFEENVRLSADAPYWATGPNATSRFDGFSVPPSRLFAHWGTWNDQPYVPGRTQVAADEVPNPQHVFASREDSAWCQLMPARVIENTFTQGRMLHFDNETRDLEGRYLPDEPLSYSPSDKKVQWAPASGGLALGISASFWIKLRALGDGTFIDFGTGALDTDRIWLGIDGSDLVLRVLDGPGDHPDSALLERGEARFELAAGTGPGLEQDTWTHIEIDVRGNRPDQISLAVDGRTLGVRTPGLTRLAASFPTGAMVFSVESGEGFPDSGVVRIGNELIEYVRQSPTIFVARHETTGPRAGFGGRIARSPFGHAATNGADPGENLGKGSVNDNHAPGTPVELYGYSLPLASNVPFGEGALPNDIGRFAVGVVTGLEVGGSPNPGEPIDIQGLLNPTIGLGMEGFNSQVTALILGPADPPPMTAATVMNAFETTGGYALVMQLGVLSIQGQPPGSIALTVNNSPVCGSEVVHYTGWAGNRLFIDRRAALPGEGNDLRPHAFVFTWNYISSTGNLNTDLDRKIFVVPISINAGASAAFLPPQPTQGSEFAQITELAAAELTEWVRYDRIEGTHLVRSDPRALENCREWVIGDPRGNLQPPIPPPPAPPGGPDSTPPQPPSTSPAPAAPAPASQANPSEWLPVVGVDEDVDAPVTRTARTALQFRGVLGTYSHAHQRDTKVLPVWRVDQGDVNNGQPGHGDYAFAVDASPSDPGFPLQVHRAYRPREYMQARWVPASDPTQAAVFAPVTTPVPVENGMQLGAIYVAANAAMRAPVAAGTSGVNVSPIETRLLSRLSLFPSGERPRDVTRVEIGRALDGSGVPSAVIDEIAFGTPLYGQGTQHAEAAFAAQMSLTSDLGLGAQSLRTMPKVIRTARGLVGDTKIFLDDLPKDAGLLRIGSEILCYDSYDSSSGAITIAPSGRGLLGSTEETHEIGAPITWLESRVVSTLAGSISAGSAILPLEDPTDFPPQGTVLIGGELIHYTHLAGSQLEMPRGSTVPGAMDGNANGLFRGRFGSTPSGHAAGEPVILFPFRYWDRWADRADAPELAYFGLTIEQPNAFWRGVFFEADEPPGTKIEVLQRLNPLMPWDAEPSFDLGQDLSLVEEGLVEGKLRAIGAQRDGLEWRAYVRYAPNAFDFALGLSHGWKRTPRLTQLAVEYLGPGLTLRRVDQ